MGVTTTQTSFKQYNRGQRVQYSEEKFDKGMHYTDTPLVDGFFKVAVNYDLKDDGEVLQPRAALRVNRLGLYKPDNATPLDFSEDLGITTGKACTENGAPFRQLVFGTVSTNKITDTRLYSGSSHIATINEALIGPVIDDNIVTNRMDTATSTTTGARFRKPEQASIHGITVSDVGHIAKQVGTFAFGNSYYHFKGTGQLVRTKFDNGKYVPEDVTIKEVSPKEAVLWGYNMLKPNPYVFTDIEAAGVIQLLGILPYDSNDNIQMSPQLNQSLKLRCYYAGVKATKYKVYWDWKEPGGSTWTTFKSGDFDLATLPAMTAEFSPPVKELMVRVTAYKYNGATLDTIAEKVMTVGFNFNKEGYGSTANIKVETYDLSTCVGMTYWKQRLILYGVAKDPTILWFSDINDPGYFTYPNGVDIFDEPIIHVTPLLDQLLVFTATKLHLLTLNTDGLTWTKKTIQGNLDIKEWDIHLIQVVKNMVFFKSGNYYYMVVPRVASTTGELTIAPVSKNMENFFDTFSTIVPEIAKTMYNYVGTLDLKHYYNFLDFEDIHNIYVFQTDKGVYLNFDVLYNTVMRIWRLHIYESQDILQPYKQDATKKGTLINIANINQRFTSGVKATPALQFYQFDNLTASDVYITNGFNILEDVAGSGTTIDDVLEKLKLVHWIKNYQLLDLGYREHITDFNKRYREFQLKFNNISQRSLKFATEFTLDGDKRSAFYKYETRQNTDPVDPNYGTIYLEPVPVLSAVVPGSTLLSPTDASSYPGYWELSTSAFPDVLLWKARLPISGKGYSPKLRLLSLNEERYELLNVSWVLRIMNSR